MAVADVADPLFEILDLPMVVDVTGPRCETQWGHCLDVSSPDHGCLSLPSGVGIVRRKPLQESNISRRQCIFQTRPGNRATVHVCIERYTWAASLKGGHQHPSVGYTKKHNSSSLKVLYLSLGYPVSKTWVKPRCHSLQLCCWFTVHSPPASLGYVIYGAEQSTAQLPMVGFEPICSSFSCFSCLVLCMDSS